MGTTEIIIVFAALMVMIALVTIGVDWIGKPLKHRRFIPRMYRFEDEKLPLDKYGNPTLDTPSPTGQPAGYWAPAYPLPGHGGAVGPPLAHDQPHYVAIAPHTPASDQSKAEPTPQTEPTPEDQPSPVVVARVDPADDLRDPQTADTFANATGNETIDTGPVVAPTPAGSSQAFSGGVVANSAFSDNLAGSDDEPPADDEQLSDSWLGADSDTSAKSSIDTSSSEPSAAEWTVDMALDAPVEGDPPSLAIKAVRFWMATAAATEASHYGPDNLDRMAQGKAPRRTNPRTGRTEAMQISGLRQALDPSDVFMQWPGDPVDPWNAT